MSFFKTLVWPLLVLSLCACSVLDTTTYDHGEEPVPEDVVEAIRPDATTKDWLLDHIGEPDQISTGKNGTSIWTYRFSENREQRIRLILFFQYKSKNVAQRHVFVHLDENGIVKRYWRDYELPAVPEDEFDPDLLQEKQLEEHMKQHNKLSASVDEQN